MLSTIRDNIVRSFASRHIAGPEIDDALVICKWAAAQDVQSALSPWACSCYPAEDVLSRYISAIMTIDREQLGSYLAIKLESLGRDFGLYSELLGVAKEHGVRIHIDSLGPEAVTENFRFLEKGMAIHPELGCTLPSRWHRSLGDAERAVGLGLYVRVVKGQWSDCEPGKIDYRKNFLDIVSRLAGRTSLGVATHDHHLAEQALKIAAKSGSKLELEQFFSLPLNGLELAKQFGCAYRVYVAYGSPSLPYNVRFILARPSMVRWLISEYVSSHRKPWQCTRVEPPVAQPSLNAKSPA